MYRGTAYAVRAGTPEKTYHTIKTEIQTVNI